MADSTRKCDCSHEEYISPSCDECRMQKGRMIASYAYCGTCETYLCVTCEKEHRETYNTHRILSGQNISQSRQRFYQICHCHESFRIYVDHFCQDHSCLVCQKCTKKSHHKTCLVCPVQDMTIKLYMKEELGKFKKEIVKFKVAVLSTKIYIGTVQNDLQRARANALKRSQADYHDKTTELVRVKNPQHAFDRKVAELGRLKDSETKVNNVFDAEYSIASTHMEDIDMVVSNLEMSYRKVEALEKKYEYQDINLFLFLQGIVAYLNQCGEDYQKLQKSFHNACISFQRKNYLHQLVHTTVSDGSAMVFRFPVIL